MNTLQKLREAQNKRNQVVNVGGADVVLAPMTTADAMAVQDRFKQYAGLKASDPRLVGFFIELICMCAVEPGTTVKALASDEARELVKNLPVDDLVNLGVAAAQVNGFAGKTGVKAVSKKKR